MNTQNDKYKNKKYNELRNNSDENLVSSYKPKYSFKINTAVTVTDYILNGNPDDQDSNMSEGEDNYVKKRKIEFEYEDYYADNNNYLKCTQASQSESSVAKLKKTY
ncbi:unnamed protein product [Brachionus calyciflorus]|uniref:Uncharacterized protein n=1 Tax=Brachionus calyciflorus TaxID=104777 RepID=A0A814KYL2_9BILA|nr:unnamed protein product [Brachionus calyciflorus]